MSADTLSELRKALEQEREARQRAETALAAEQELRLRTLHRAEQAERERDEARKDGAAAFIAGKAEARENVERSEVFTEAVRGLEWQRRDWLGLCVFRRAAGCHATDGRNSGAGTPTPKPHDEGCPFHLLAAADALKEKS